MSEHIVAAIVGKGVRAFELSCLIEIFQEMKPQHVESWYQLKICSLEKELNIAGGITIQRSYDFDALNAASTIIILSWRDTTTPPPEFLLFALREAHHRGARICSICSGASVLAATGLLTNKTAITHWNCSELLSSQYPDLKVDAKNLYHEDGNILTSAGAGTMLDILLHIVRADFGPAIANDIAQRLLLSSHRVGTQNQKKHQPLSDIHAQANNISLLLEWLEENISIPHTIESLAQRMSMSISTFQRHFLLKTGMTAIDWIINLRLRLAKELLITSDLPLKKIAAMTGFNTIDNFRYHFRKEESTTPKKFRESLNK
ncbi:transcriptional regulator containing an amidase domain and an AraC-type DNA-binding HTH domain [Serratia sp. FGI94]|uniref:helix-turn-helix domain-containing protein n=1 Tax=Serratia sp. FGI94 TaxID=671990 RepID=UPI0002A73084|nr:helix-turn-helix domain-containing protein [Serratia sp. FGI94]AGB83994.1 transcriptional regulator containing an amidase domain and an AraC-type DNA-binding HTH domain [Serratia sp. FGI94]